MMRSFGERLRSARRSAGLSQAQMAGDEFSVSYVSHLEHDRRQPSAELVAYFEERLGVPPGYLAADAWGAAGPGSAPDADSAVLAQLVMRASEAHALRDAEASQALCASAARKALSMGRPEVWWQMSLTQVSALIDLGRYAEAAEAAQVLVDHPWVSASVPLHARAYLDWSKSLHLAGRVEDARPAAARALELASDETGFPDASARADLAARALINALSVGAEPQDVLASRLEATIDQVTSSDLRGLVAWTLGNLAFMAADPATGVAWHDRAESLLTAAGDFRNWARFARATVNSRILAGLDDRLGELLERARVSTQLLGNPAVIAELAQTEALWLHRQGMPQEAVGVLQAAAATTGLAPLAAGRLQLDIARYADHDPEVQRAAVLAAARDLTAAGATDEAMQAWELHDRLSEAS